MIFYQYSDIEIKKFLKLSHRAVNLSMNTAIRQAGSCFLILFCRLICNNLKDTKKDVKF